MSDFQITVDHDDDHHNASAEEEHPHVDSASDHDSPDDSSKRQSPSMRSNSNRKDSKRKQSNASSGRGMLGGDAQSVSGASKMKRSPSFMASEFNDDAQREKTHLRSANASLEEKLVDLRKQVQDLRAQGLSRDAQKSLQDIEEDNEAVRQEIAKLRTKVGAVSNVETLDNLTDQLATREVDLKGLEVRVKNLSEENYSNAKLVRDKEDREQNPQAVFLDLKNERRRFQKRLDKSRVSIEKSREAHSQVTARLRELEEQETSLGLNQLTHDDIVSTQKKYEANEKELEKLKRKLISFEGTCSVRSMQTARKSQNIVADITELQSQVRSLEAQVMKLETTIMANQKLRERPPHFIEPMEMHTPTAIALQPTPATSPRASQAPQKPSEPAPQKSARQAPPPKRNAQPTKKSAAAAPPTAEKQQQQPPPQQQQQQAAKKPVEPKPPAAKQQPDKKKPEEPAKKKEADVAAKKEKEPAPKQEERRPQAASDDRLDSLDRSDSVEHSPRSYTPSDTLHRNDRLNVGEMITASNRVYEAVMQHDGNFVIYDRDAKRATWATNTCGQRATHFVVSAAGGVEVLDGQSVVWAADLVSGGSAAKLVLESDGSLVAYDDEGIVVWSSNAARVPRPPSAPRAEQSAPRPAPSSRPASADEEPVARSPTPARTPTPAASDYGDEDFEGGSPTKGADDAEEKKDEGQPAFLTE